jgi:hypothetical protein
MLEYWNNEILECWVLKIFLSAIRSFDKLRTNGVEGFAGMTENCILGLFAIPSLFSSSTHYSNIPVFRCITYAVALGFLSSFLRDFPISFSV